MNEDDILSKKMELIEIAQRCFERGLQTGSGGNLSVRLEQRDAVVIKPSGVGYAECSIDNLMVVNFDKKILSGDLTPSKDMPFHIAIYKVRPDVQAIVHVHSPWSTAWSCKNEPLPLLALHARAKLGDIPTVPTAPDGSTQTDTEMGEVFKNPKCCAALMARHGAVGVGNNLIAAQHVVELIEETAQIATIGSTIGAK